MKKIETILEKIKTDFKIDITELPAEEQKYLMDSVKEYVTIRRIKGAGIFLAVVAWIVLSVGALIAGVSDISPSVTYDGISGGIGTLLCGGVVIGKSTDSKKDSDPSYEYIGVLFDKCVAEAGKKWDNLYFDSDEKFIDLVRGLMKLPFSMNEKIKSLKQ